MSVWVLDPPEALDLARRLGQSHHTANVAGDRLRGASFETPTQWWKPFFSLEKDDILHYNSTATGVLSPGSGTSPGPTESRGG